MSTTDELHRALEYYRSECDTLGGRVLRLQQELTEARRDARRQRLIARLAQQLHARAISLDSDHQDADRGATQLGDILVSLLVDMLRLDCAAVLGRTAQPHELRVEHSLGLDANLRLFVPDPLPPRALGPQPACLPRATWEALAALGLHHWFWQAAPRVGKALLLGSRQPSVVARGGELAFDEADRIVPEVVLEMYLGLCERHTAACALRTAQTDYRTVFDCAQDVFVVLDARRAVVLEANRRAHEMLKCTPEQLTARPLRHWLAPDEAPSIPWRRHWRRALTGHTARTECRVRDASGQLLWVELQLTRIGERARHRLLAVARDIDARKQGEERLRAQAFRDDLTHLPNRALMFERLTIAFARRRREHGFCFALLFLDLDRFKVVNDSLGHHVGDQLLKAIGQRLHAALRATDTIARLGGDEFLVLIEDLANPEAALECARRLEQALLAPFSLNGHELFMRASIGIVLADERHTTPEDLLRDADLAMYRAKRQNTQERCAWFDPSMHERALADMALERDLRRALQRQEFVVHYQPIVALSSGHLVGFEALIRWRHPERGLVLPGQFIPLAEETLLVLGLNLFVLDEACRQAIIWARLRPAAPPTVNVNLSGRDFTQRDLAAEIVKRVRAQGCTPELIHLEVTESAVLADAEAARATLTELHDHGFTLCMDDFGTGYSSLSYLHRLPFDIIKIDRSFVCAIERDNDARAIAHAIASLAESLRKHTVAEGIETSAQLEYARDRLHCHAAQGYYFSRPVDSAAATALLASPPWLRAG